eukprot:s1714_g12.t1
MILRDGAEMCPTGAIGHSKPSQRVPANAASFRYRSFLGCQDGQFPPSNHQYLWPKHRESQLQNVSPGSRLLKIWGAKALLTMPKRTRSLDAQGLSRVDAAQGDANWLTGRAYSKRFFEILKARRKLPCWEKQNAAVEMEPEFDNLVPQDLRVKTEKPAASSTSFVTKAETSSVAKDSVGKEEDYSEKKAKHQPSRGKRRRQLVRELNQKKLSDFLTRQGFSSDVNEPRGEQPGCFFSFSRKKKENCCGANLFQRVQETIYPVHAAAELGDVKLLRLLLAAGADAQQRTSKGHLPIDFALAKEMNHSHDGVIALLEEDLCITNLRGAWEKMQ